MSGERAREKAMTPKNQKLRNIIKTIQTGDMRLAIILFEEAMAATREDCAQWHDEQARKALNSRDRLGEHDLSGRYLFDDLARVHFKAADHIRARTEGKGND